MNGLEAKPFTNLSSLHKSRGVLQNARRMCRMAISIKQPSTGRSAERPYSFWRNMLWLPVLSLHGIGNQRDFQICWLNFFLSSELFLPFCLIIFICCLRIFVTNFVICVRNFVTRITNFVICVTKFVIKTFCADRKKLLRARERQERYAKYSVNARLNDIWRSAHGAGFL